MSGSVAVREINGEIYSAEAGVVDRVLDGPEAHNILAWSLYIMFGDSSGQSTSTRRSTTSTGRSEVRAVLDVFDECRLQDMEGRSILALRKGEDNHYGPIVGVANAQNPNRFYLFNS